MVTHVTGSRRGEREIFDEPAITIGRSRESKLRLGLNDTRASTRHAELRLERGRYVLIDLGSTNGTYVNGRRASRHRLRNGDVASFGFGGPQVRFEFFETISSQRPSIEEPHEFPFRSRFKWWLWGGAVVAVVAVVVLVALQMVLYAIPLGLAAAAFFFIGLSVARINITVGPEGIEHEGMFRTTRIPWSDVVALESGRGRTGVLAGIVCTVRGRGGTVRFAPRDFVEGHLLARLVAEATGKEWA
jgi:hypothetical protein